jgi:hypothetical protein
MSMPKFSYFDFFVPLSSSGLSLYSKDCYIESSLSGCGECCIGSPPSSDLLTVEPGFRSMIIRAQWSACLFAKSPSRFYSDTLVPCFLKPLQLKYRKDNHCQLTEPVVPYLSGGAVGERFNFVLLRATLSCRRSRKSDGYDLIFLSSQAMFWAKVCMVSRASSSFSTSPLANPKPTFQ